jgi:membrane fusion protein, heavy metal efflux system
MNRMLLALGAALLVTTACTDPASNEVETARAGSVTATHYSDATELFVEYRLLASGRQRRFDAHLTWLDSGRPVNEGELAVELVHSDGTVDRGTASVSDTPGIFRVLIRPSKPGSARLRLILSARGRTITHDLGAVQIYPTSEAAAKATPPHEENPDRIAFPKEAQWQIPFDSEPATGEERRGCGFFACRRRRSHRRAGAGTRHGCPRRPDAGDRVGAARRRRGCRLARSRHRSSPHRG